jgi:dTMP kinase
MAEAMLYAASRAQHVEEVIKPALEAGKIVMCDRFVDSSIAYQGYGRKLGEAVAIINSFAIGNCIPDITFLLKLDPSIGRGRIKASDQDRLEQEQDDFHFDVYTGYLELEEKYKDRIVGIDASKSIEEIRLDIYKKLEEVMKSVTK